jgi:hypothetical protein
MADSWFLVVADYKSGEQQVTRYPASRAAQAAVAYGHKEAEYRKADSVDVVLIASEDEQSLRLRYPHLFTARKASKKAAIRALSTPAYA